MSISGPFSERRSFSPGRASPRQPRAPPQRPRVHIPCLAHPREQLPSPHPRISRNLGPSPPCYMSTLLVVLCQTSASVPRDLGPRTVGRTRSEIWGRGSGEGRPQQIS